MQIRVNVATQIRIFLKPHTFSIQIGFSSTRNQCRNRICLKPHSRVDLFDPTGSAMWTTEIGYIFYVSHVIDTEKCEFKTSGKTTTFCLLGYCSF